MIAAVTTEDEAAVRALLAAGATVDATCSGGWTALHLASEPGQAALVELPIAAGGGVNAKGLDGRTALYWASRNDHAAVVKRLLAAGADVDAKTKAGWTALHVASWRGHNAVAALLLAAGADVNAVNDDAETAGDLAELLRDAPLDRDGHHDRPSEASVAPPASVGAAEELSSFVVAPVTDDDCDDDWDDDWDAMILAEEATSTDTAVGGRAAAPIRGEDAKTHGQCPVEAPGTAIAEGGSVAVGLVVAERGAEGAPAQGEEAIAGPNQEQDYVPTPGEEVDDTPTQEEEADATPAPDRDSEVDGEFLSADISQGEVAHWLARFLPRLQEEDAVHYRARLAADGFDSSERLAIVQENISICLLN